LEYLQPPPYARDESIITSHLQHLQLLEAASIAHSAANMEGPHNVTTTINSATPRICATSHARSSWHMLSSQGICIMASHRQDQHAAMPRDLHHMQVQISWWTCTGHHLDASCTYITCDMPGLGSFLLIGMDHLGADTMELAFTCIVIHVHTLHSNEQLLRPYARHHGLRVHRCQLLNHICHIS
jgi:hypothetical protein